MAEEKVEEKPEEKKPEGEEPEEKPEEKPESEEPEELEGIGELLKKPGAELDAMAKEKGLDLRSYHTKTELAKAILESKE